MAEEKATVQNVDYRQLFPWLALFRSFGIAIDPKKMVLATVGALLTAIGWLLLAELFRSVSKDDWLQQHAQFAQWPWGSDRWSGFSIQPVSTDPGLVEELLHAPNALWSRATYWRFILSPVGELLRPFQLIFASEAGFVPVVFVFLCGVWAVAVWAMFGGAITRIAAVQFAREEKIGLMESLKFAASKFLSFWGAPLIPLAFIAFFALFCVLGGVITRIPGFGPVFAGALWFLPLLAGFVMAIILIGWAIGWPLMFCTISVEGSDSFDALSRSFAYVFQRPWHYLFYAVLAASFGSLCFFFVLVFANLLLHMASWAVSWGAGNELVNELVRSTGAKTTTGISIGAGLVAFWSSFVLFLIVGFIYSYFWSASTIIYYLLRRAVDNTELQEVFLEGEEEEFEMPGGTAASPSASGSVGEAQPSAAELSQPPPSVSPPPT